MNAFFGINFLKKDTVIINYLISRLCFCAILHMLHSFVHLINNTHLLIFYKITFFCINANLIYKIYTI